MTRDIDDPHYKDSNVGPGMVERPKMHYLGREFPHIRYERDAQFRILVDQLCFYIMQGSYTPTELREACHLAACMYEERHVRPILIDPKEPFKWNIK